MRVSNRSEGSDGKFRRFPRLGWLALAAALALVAAGCSSSSSSSAPAASGSASATGSATVPAVSISSFTVHIAPTMSLFKALAAAGTKGANSLQVGVVLPDTTSSTRWVDFDAPYLRQAFTAAGYTSKQFRIDNAQGSDATQLSDATADINLGAKILIVCPLDGPTGVAIAKLAEQKGVTLIAYDRAIFEGTKTYYVSFDNEHVGELIGTGFNDVRQVLGDQEPEGLRPEWRPGHRPQRHLLCLRVTTRWSGDKAAKTVAAGATNSSGASLVGENFAPGWDNTKGGTIFQQEFTAHPQINATIEANDGLANSVITDLKAAGVKPKSVPTTGQDATAQGMAWVLQGYQCGSVYKAVYKEAQDSVAMATILLAGATPPPALLNGKTVDPADSSITEPATLLTPGVGDQGQHAVDSRRGRLRHGHADLHDCGSGCLHRSWHPLIS